MLRIWLITAWMIASSVVPSNNVRPVFGVKVSIGPNSQLTTFVCYLYNGRVLSQRRYVDPMTFVKFVSGYWPSIYNPNRINYFKENNIDCSLIEDQSTQEETLNCFPMDSLWKIRFSTYPFRHNSEIGWSNKYHKPSPGQEKYLFERYDIKHIDGDYFLDTNFWLLMQDVTDPLWIANYKSIQ